GRAVVVSRGEAVEIGGGFRVPDVMRQSGATLVEVGTTNRTYVADYLAATDEATAAYLKVHASNFRIVGFTHAATVAELAVAKPSDVYLLEDLGSGALLDTARFGLAPEPTIGGSVAAGAQLVMASGDKLLGGPQAGVIVGERALVERVGRHPLARAVRADKTALAGLAATLRHYARGEAEREIPVWRMIAAPAPALRARAARLADELRDLADVAVVETRATVGGGSLPGETLPSWAVALPHAGVHSTDDLARRLRLGAPGVFGRVEHDRVLLDLRTVLPEDEDRLVAATREALGRD
ncbi:MAG TPA: L-seryl-tRNA(Sec) selenium transferase, partial [Thermomicrobiales bacterium]|nr:L-seryl-tRNA(Sec) selenium transferase [Thermomicrobiales bacterium]